MSKPYIRKRDSLTIGGKSHFHCKKCPFKTDRKDLFKKHLCPNFKKQA